MIEGTTLDGFEPVQEAFEALWENIEVGAALAIFVEDQLVVDLWGGHTNRDRTIPWQRDTLTNSYSITKGIVSMALACLVEDGKLDYHKPVADYWPAFGAQSKFRITVAEALSHQAGVYTFEPAISTHDLYDWQKPAFNIASQKPAWTPGTAFGYHAITWGYIAGELINRITNMSAGQYLRHRITDPINADFFIGLNPAEQARCAETIGPNHARVPLTRADHPKRNTLPGNDPAIAPFRDVSSAAWRSAEIPASNGHGSGVGLARCYQATLSGELFSAKTQALALQEETDGETDLCLGQKLRRSRGFILNCEPCYFGPTKRAFGHAGTGGSTAFADPHHKVAFAYLTNQLHVSGPVRYRKLIDTFYDCLLNG